MKDALPTLSTQVPPPPPAAHHWATVRCTHVPAVLVRTQTHPSLTPPFHPQVHLALISVQLIFGVGAVIGK